MSEIFYSKNHIWIKYDPETNEAVLGLSEYAVGQLGAIMFVNIAEPDSSVSEGETFGDVESIKTVSDLISPVGGKVTDINAALADEPSLINENPYENWIVKIIPDNFDKGLFMNEEAYSEYTEVL